MKTIITTMVVALVLGGNMLITESEAPQSDFQLSRHQIIVKQAVVYGASAEMIRNVGTCESGLSMIPVGAEGEIGAYQFKRQTFESMALAMGQKLDIRSFEDQTKLISWVSVNHPEWMKQWSTWRVWYGKGLNRCR